MSFDASHSSRPLAGRTFNLHTVKGQMKLRFRDGRFWLVQAMVVVVTALHYAVEQFPVFTVQESVTVIHHVPVILYLFPVVYASLHYGWEGGVLTAIWSGVLTLPSIVLSHRADFHWFGESVLVSVTLLVGAVLAWRVQLEAQARELAEAVSRELAESERRYRGIFEHAGDPILICSPEGKILAANRAAVIATGYSADELRAMPVTRLFGPEGGPALLQPQNDSGERYARLELTTKSGRVALVDIARTGPVGPGDQTIQAILRDVTEQERRREELRTYVREVTRAQEEERRRIARELHDDAAQTLVLVCRRLEGNPTPEKLEETRNLVESVLENIRRFSRDLRPSVLDDLGLLPAIEWIAAEATRASQVEVEVSVEGPAQRLREEAELLLFRIAQEGLRNVTKHAGPCKATVTVRFSPDEVELSVVDDGRGFEVGNAGELAQLGKLGLLGMRERAQLLGAELAIDSKPGRGTTIKVALPLDGIAR